MGYAEVSQDEQFELANYFLTKSLTLSQQSNGYFLSEIKYQYAKLYKKQGFIEQSIDAAIAGIESLNKDDYINKAKLFLILSELTEEKDPSRSLTYLKQYQHNREKFLKQEYDSGIKAIQHVIEKKQIEHTLSMEKKQVEHTLSLERLALVSKDLKLKSLNNKFIFVIIVLILLITILVLFYVAKKRERRYFLAKIKNHKQQLVVLNDQPSNDVSLENAEEDISKEDFCKHLVETMTDAVDIWEKHTNTNRVELADLSGIWTISNDDGYLRTRSLDKYLSLDRIPKNPRWRNVVRTCHFVLSDEKISRSARERLEKKLSTILTLFQNLSSQTTDSSE